MIPEGYVLYKYDNVGSTNDVAKELSELNLHDSFIVSANMQTAGRGRGSNDWFSPEGNIYLSIVENEIFDSNLTIVISVIMFKSINNFLSANKIDTELLKIKWPNDILWNGQKLAGVLIEVIDGKTVIGVGINTNAVPGSFYDHVISLQGISGGNIDNDNFIKDLLFNYKKYMSVFKKEGFSYFYDTWMDNNSMMNKNVCVDVNGDIVEGVFCGINDSGFAKLRLSSGKFEYVNVVGSIKI